MSKLSKWQGSVLAVVGMLVSVSTLGHAFTGGVKTTRVATVTLSGAGTVAFDIAVKRMSDNVLGTDLTWTGVTLPVVGGWKNSDHYIQLNSTITAGNGGIRIVTDNKGAGANPLYSGPNATAAGLVDNTDTTQALSMSWSIKDSVVGSTGPVSAKPYETADGPGQTAQFQWLYMTDVADSLTPQGAPYRTAVNSTGIHFGGGNAEFGAAASPNYVYFGANFATAVTPRTYSTNRLTVEAFTE